MEANFVSYNSASDWDLVSWGRSRSGNPEFEAGCEPGSGVALAAPPHCWHSFRRAGGATQMNQAAVG